MPQSMHMPTLSCSVRLRAGNRILRSVLLVLALLGAVLLPAAAAWPEGYAEQAAAPSAQAKGGESKLDDQDPGNLEPGTRVPVPPPFPPVEPERMEMNDWQRVSHVAYWDGWFRPHGRTQYGSYEISRLMEVDGSAAVVLRHTFEGANHRVRLDNGRGEWRVGETVRKQAIEGVTEELVVFNELPIVAPSFIALDLQPTDPAATRPRNLLDQGLEFPRWAPDWSLPADAEFGPVIKRVVGVNNARRGPANRTEYLVDLDDGNLLRLPANADMRYRHIVTLRHGFDIRLDPMSGFAKYNIAVLEPAPKDAWDRFTPQQLDEELAQAALDTGVRAVDYSSLPVDFLFKTREGGIGLLRVKQSPQHPGSLVLLIKPVDQGPPPNAIADGVATADAVIQSTTVEAGRAVFKGRIDAAHELVVRIERDAKPLEWRSSGRGDVFEVVVEASDKIPLGEGKTGKGFIVTSKVGTTIAGSGADVTNVHLAGDLAGAFTIRAKADLVTNAGAVTFADVALEGGEKLPVTFRLLPKTK